MSVAVRLIVIHIVTGFMIDARLYVYAPLPVNRSVVMVMMLDDALAFHDAWSWTLDYDVALSIDWTVQIRAESGHSEQG